MARTSCSSARASTSQPPARLPARSTCHARRPSGLMDELRRGLAGHEPAARPSRRARRRSSARRSRSRSRTRSAPTRRLSSSSGFGRTNLPTNAGGTLLVAPPWFLTPLFEPANGLDLPVAITSKRHVRRLPGRPAGHRVRSRRFEEPLLHAGPRADRWRLIPAWAIEFFMSRAVTKSGTGATVSPHGVLVRRFASRHRFGLHLGSIVPTTPTLPRVAPKGTLLKGPGCCVRFAGGLHPRCSPDRSAS
jgi:hypothetical protein